MTPTQLAFAPSSPREPEAGTAEANVLSAFRCNPNRSLSRPLLVALTGGIGDRDVREAIESLRRMGWPIASDSRHAGYRLCLSPEELTATIKEYRCRAQKAREMAEALELAQFALGAREATTA